MAETLAVVAASLQLSEIFLKLSTRGGKLAIRLKNAPDEIRLKTTTVEDFQKFCMSCQLLITKHALRIDTLVDQNAIDHIQELLERVESSIDVLEHALSELQPQPTDGQSGALRKRLKSVQKSESIAKQLRALGDVREQLDSYFVRQIWSHLADHSANTEAGITQIQASQTQVEGYTKTIVQQQGAAEGLLFDVRAIVDTISGTQQSMSNQIIKVHDELESGFASAHQSIDTTQCDVRHTGRSLEEQINRGFGELHDSLKELTFSEDSVGRLARQLEGYMLIRPIVPDHTATAPDMNVSLFCPCQRLGRAERLVTIGPITIVSRKYGTHLPGCQYYDGNEGAVVERKTSVRLSGRYADYRNASLMRFAVTTTSFLAGIICTTRFVDKYSKDAPGFKHMAKAHSEILMALDLPLGDSLLQYKILQYKGNVTTDQLQRCRKSLMQLHTSLLDDFQRSRDWARIQAWDGETLLHALHKTLLCLWTVQEGVSDIINSILHLLIKGGTPVDTIKEGFEWLLLYEDNNLKSSLMPGYETALSLCISCLPETSTLTRNRTIFLQLLAKHEVPAFSSRSPPIDPWAIPRLFSAIPDLAIEYGCSRLCLAVITRDRGLVEHLLHSQVEANDSCETYSALCFAVGWLAGVKMLLKAEADPWQATHFAIVYQALESLDLLIQADTWYFCPVTKTMSGSPSFVCSLVDLALWRRSIQPDFDSRILTLLIKAIVRARVELMELAKQHLPPSQLENLGWRKFQDPIYKIDSAALGIYQKLEEMGVPCRKNLFPGMARTIYHTPFITPEVAEGFWSAGFSEIDEYDESGVTPLLMNTQGYQKGHWRTLYWFLQHGAKNLTFPALHNNTLVHKLAADFGTWGPSVDDKTYEFGLPDILLQAVKHLPPYPRDECECFCSREGCSPVTALIKHISRLHPAYVTWRKYKDKENLFRQFARFCPKSLCGKPGFSDLCRVELFDRLGMRHTCCRFGIVPGNSPAGFCVHISPNNYFIMLDPSEAAEFREEDAYSNVKLQSLMRLYEELDLEYDSEFEAFWKTWWAVLNDYVPELDEAKRWGTNLLDALPLPVDSLDETLLEIREQITRSMALRHQNDFAEGGEG